MNVSKDSFPSIESLDHVSLVGPIDGCGDQK